MRWEPLSLIILKDATPQRYRIWIIDTTDEEEQCMMNKAIDLNKKLKTINLGPLPVANNCFSRTNMIFEACGFSNPL